MRVMQKDLIERLGGRCNVCDSIKNLHVNHRWYVAEDKGTGGKWKKILALYEKNPKRFSCLCSRCNQLTGALCAVINDPADIYGRFIDEVSQMAEGRKDSPFPYQIVSMRQYNNCVVCGVMIAGRGKTCGKECQDNLDVSRRKKYASGPHVPKRVPFVTRHSHKEVIQKHVARNVAKNTDTSITDSPIENTKSV